MRLKIKELRKQKKLNQQDLADKIDVSVRMLGEYEKQTTDIGIKKLQKIAEIFEVSLFDLVELDSSEIHVFKETDPVYNTSVDKELLAMKNKIIELLEEENKRLKEENIMLKGQDKSRSA